MNNSKLINSLLSLVLVVLVAALYVSFRWNPIVFDDIYFFLMDNDGNQPVSNYHFEWLQIRSLPYATLAWTKAWFGLDLINFRIGNLLLHAAVVLVLFAFLSSLFIALIGDGRKESLSPRLYAFFAAALFALHPVATYAVGYLVQRSIVMATLFSLLALMAYVRGSVQQNLLWLWLTVPFYYLAVFSKEHAIMLPAVLLALTVLLHVDWPTRMRQHWGIFVMLALIAIAALLTKRGLLGSVYELNAPEMLLDADLAYPLSVMTQTWLFFKYVFLWVLPNPAWMSIDMREPFAPSLFSPYLMAVMAFGAWGIGSIWLLTKRGMAGLAGLALLYPWLMFMTEFSTVRIQEVFVLYRSYLWAPVAFCLLPVIFSKLNGRLSAFILSLLAVAMVSMSMDRLVTLSHPILLWDDAEKLVKGRTELPGSSRIYYTRGTEMIHMGNLDQAIADLNQSASLSPRFVEAHGNLGAAYFQKLDWNNAIASFSHAIEIAHQDNKAISARYIHGRAQAFENTGELEKAQIDYRESCRLAQRGCEKLINK